jgi:hypothetical protein
MVGTANLPVRGPASRSRRKTRADSDRRVPANFHRDEIRRRSASDEIRRLRTSWRTEASVTTRGFIRCTSSQSSWSRGWPRDVDGRVEKLVGFEDILRRLGLQYHAGDVHGRHGLWLNTRSRPGRAPGGMVPEVSSCRCSTTSRPYAPTSATARPRVRHRSLRTRSTVRPRPHDRRDHGDVPAVGRPNKVLDNKPHGGSS